MENRERERARDEELDARIDRILKGKPETKESESASENVARALARLAAEESPRLAAASRARGLNELRAQATLKHKPRRSSSFAKLAFVPRWAQIAAVAIIVVALANSVSTVAADSLPGSWWYLFKRIGEGGQLLLQNTHGQRAQLWMNLANTRLDEVQRLIASGARVNPAILDAVDESIMHALSEIAGTRGSERVELLKQLTQLAIRQQEVVDTLAHNASPEDRARLEQTARFLKDVAVYSASDAAVESDSSPLQFLTPSVTPPQSSTVAPTPTATLTRTATPTETPSPSALRSPTAFENPSATIAAGTDDIEPAVTPVPLIPPTKAPGETSAPQKTREQEPTDEPDETDAPEPADSPEPTERPEPTEQPDETDSPEPTEQPDETDSPEPTEQPDETDSPEPTEQPDETDEPDETKEPKPNKTPDDGAALYYFFISAVDSFEI